MYDKSFEGVESFLSSGVDVNTSNDEGRTLLMEAIGGSFNSSTNGYDTNIINLLISKSANVNAKDNDGESAIFRGYNLKSL